MSACDRTSWDWGPKPYPTAYDVCDCGAPIILHPAASREADQ